MKYQNFGEHLTLDGYRGDKQKLNSQKLVRKCLNELPKLLNMKKLSRPEVYFAKANDKKDPGGWSGFVVIAESHISLHTFPGREFLSADVYTCHNGMNRKFIVSYLKEQFGLRQTEVNFLKRGTRDPVENY